MSQHSTLAPLPDLAKRTEKMIRWLASFGANPNGGVTRLLYTPSWLEAQSALAQKMEEIGLHVFFDDVGNLYGRLEANQQSSGSILTGSHVDTVKNGGKYDGAYGIIAGLIALQYLKDTYGPPRKHLEVVSLCEEEGSRFPYTYWGSGSITGTASYSQIQNLKDAQDIGFEKAMLDAGFGNGSHKPANRDDVLAFIELHIEQGAILEHEQKSIGIVEQIVGQKRYTVVLTGEANHAGTTPMALRKDALRGASQMVQYLMDSTDRTGAPLVATVGKFSIEPNIPNVIPNKVTFSVDVRHPSGTILDQFSEQFEQEFRNIAKERDLSIVIDKWMDARPVEMDIQLTNQAESICQNLGIPHKRMASGAGHDSQVFAPFCPTSLIFVPSHRGISHSPLEHTSINDLETGIKVLIELLYQLGYETEE
ncbi:allantoate deiminase [Fodinisporobacter ferrooxydans]|uniref:Allantoate deiminase n=1 Tax=Fodinisporobacter ferrooxydans TaxID=2901836 RepID=A0ABY4CQY7_9BACL|nr:allantoate deiminase [Alicyclobacillaceae bacterium MYW30-H2]